jgi:hypothetical protein
VPPFGSASRELRATNCRREGSKKEALLAVDLYAAADEFVLPIVARAALARAGGDESPAAARSKEEPPESW